MVRVPDHRPKGWGWSPAMAHTKSEAVAEIQASIWGLRPTIYLQDNILDGLSVTLNACKLSDEIQTFSTRTLICGPEPPNAPYNFRQWSDERQQLSIVPGMGNHKVWSCREKRSWKTLLLSVLKLFWKAR